MEHQSKRPPVKAIGARRQGILDPVAGRVNRGGVVETVAFGIAAIDLGAGRREVAIKFVRADHT